MNIPQDLLCVFNAEVEKRGNEHIIKVPDNEIEAGTVSEGDAIQVSLYNGGTSTTRSRSGRKKKSGSGRNRTNGSSTNNQSPPVEEGEERVVEIESIGSQGDGIAKVERGFVVIVPETSRGDEVRVEIKDVRDNVAMAEVIEPRKID